jgi:hypothetical protein
MRLPAQDIEATEERCKNDPSAENIRQALLKIEAEGEEGGWDAPPQLFGLECDTQVTVEPLLTLSDALLHALDWYHGNMGLALQHMARALVVAAKEFDLGVGDHIHGFVLRSEAFVNPRLNPGETMDPSLQEAFKEHRLHSHPERVEARIVVMMGRDGLFWLVLRERGEDPEVVAMMPEGDFQHFGNLGNALGRMIAAVVSNPVPVPERYS